MAILVNFTVRLCVSYTKSSILSRVREALVHTVVVTEFSSYRIQYTVDVVWLCDDSDFSFSLFFRLEFGKHVFPINEIVSLYEQQRIHTVYYPTHTHTQTWIKKIVENTIGVKLMKRGSQFSSSNTRAHTTYTRHAHTHNAPNQCAQNTYNICGTVCEGGETREMVTSSIYNIIRNVHISLHFVRCIQNCWYSI